MYSQNFELRQNILSAKAPNEAVTFIHPDDLKMYQEWEYKAFELQVANHELLGHGTGKLFQEDVEGKLNFDLQNVRCLESQDCSSMYHSQTINPLTGDLVYVV